jgi:hypothetical protein
VQDLTELEIVYEIASIRSSIIVHLIARGHPAHKPPKVLGGYQSISAPALKSAACQVQAGFPSG